MTLIFILAGLIAIPFVVYAVSWVIALTSRENWQIPQQDEDDDKADR